MVLICISLTSDFEHLFYIPVALCVSRPYVFFGEMSTQVLYPFFNLNAK